MQLLCCIEEALCFLDIFLNKKIIIWVFMSMRQEGKRMATRITHVQEGSVAYNLGLRENDQLISIAGEPIIDQIDYQALTAESRFDMLVEHSNGRQELMHVIKQDWEPLGLTLDQTIVSSPRHCTNHCVFCFIDQMPTGMRKTLYVRDDDWRLSLMMGNYITMTNMSDDEFDRIIRRRVSPLYISVHATDSDTRCRMMRNPAASQLLPRLHQLKSAGLRFHCQIVLCPGWNDGIILDKTLIDLSEFFPAACSVAVVPVGLTKFRERLPHLECFSASGAAAVLDQIEKLQNTFLQTLGTRFVFPSDEFFCISGKPIPDDLYYEDYPQIENGVGMLRQFENDLRYASEDYPVSETPPRHLAIACGTSIAENMRKWCSSFAPEGTVVDIYPIVNHFFGSTVTVTGLITGKDLIEQLQGIQCDQLLLSRTMLRSEGDLFLDDVSINDVQNAL